ncbi:MAG: glycoside hydrolase family 3 protein [Balneolaceae bacterium]|nr:glycoside hydrolase family 3 protein [Balneolaceae bacterium]MBO6546764.1 glycoside hydrolase family 3 protein [Balneolaceae bacterium]MBO6649124.1 glycoside hydrolase family 3 protein [Balneolaceae bacterium]
MKKLYIVLCSVILLSCSAKPVEDKQQDTAFTDRELGQLLVIGFRGTEINPESDITKDIKELNIGGVVLFDYDVESKSYGRNIESDDQLLKLASSLVAYSSTPPIISIDQEGGQVARLKPSLGFPKTVSAQYLGEIDNEDSTRFYARRTAQEFMVVGVNTNFAPVLDVNTNPKNPVIARYERSYSSNPKKVAEHAGYVIDEFDVEGILTVLKHFPGHGSSTTDSHLGVTDVTDTWTEDELIPYKILFEEKNINAVMTAHIYNANIDPDWPATLSPATINGLLRDSLGFEGVVFSDDMQMDAIRSEYGLETAIEQSLNAGVDILMFGNNLVYEEDIAQTAIDIIQKLIAEGKVSEETIQASLDRVAKLKKDVIEDLCTCLNF